MSVCPEPICCLRFDSLSGDYSDKEKESEREKDRKRERERERERE